MSEIASIFWNNVFSKNIIFIQFFGILLALVETNTLRTSLKKGLKFSTAILAGGILGWIFMGWISGGYEPILIWVFLITSLFSAHMLQRWGELQESWKGFPRFILILVPMIGLQWTVWEQGIDYIHKIFMITGNVAGFYLAFILIATIKEQVKLSEAPEILKKIPTILIAIGFFALAFMGFSFM